MIESISKHFIHLPAISDKNKMSELSDERLKKLVEKCVNSAEVDEASMKGVRNLCRKDEALISTLVAELLWFLKRKHCVVRFYKFYINLSMRFLKLSAELFGQVALLTACRLAVP